jgi:hypothetical protein
MKLNKESMIGIGIGDMKKAMKYEQSKEYKKDKRQDKKKLIDGVSYALKTAEELYKKTGIEPMGLLYAITDKGTIAHVVDGNNFDEKSASLEKFGVELGKMGVMLHALMMITTAWYTKAKKDQVLKLMPREDPKHKESIMAIGHSIYDNSVIRMATITRKGKKITFREDKKGFDGFQDNLLPTCMMAYADSMILNHAGTTK